MLPLPLIGVVSDNLHGVGELPQFLLCARADCFEILTRSGIDTRHERDQPWPAVCINRWVQSNLSKEVVTGKRFSLIVLVPPPEPDPWRRWLLIATKRGAVEQLVGGVERLQAACVARVGVIDDAVLHRE
jgi:hypothetical protein